VHAFVTSRVDYCNAVYAEAPKSVTGKLQRVLNAAARVVTDTGKFDRGLTSLLHDELHWLDVPERVTYKMGDMMYRCLHGQARWHLGTSPTISPRPPTSLLGFVCVLQTDTSSLYLAVVSTQYGRRAFSIAGQTVWNSLPDELRDPACDSDSFRQFLKTILFSLYYNVTSALEVFKCYALYKSTIYLLTIQSDLCSVYL